MLDTEEELTLLVPPLSGFFEVATGSGGVLSRRAGRPGWLGLPGAPGVALLVSFLHSKQILVRTHSYYTLCILKKLLRSYLVFFT